MIAVQKTSIALMIVFVVIASCNDGDKKEPVLENKHRIECEKRSQTCGGKDAMRFYKSVPLIQTDSAGNVTITDVWSSYVVCCDMFERLIDSLRSYNQFLDSAIQRRTPFNKSDTVGTIHIYAGLEYYGEWLNKSWEWVSFGDSTFRWLMPRGKYFDEHVKNLEEAHKRCCIL